MKVRPEIRWIVVLSFFLILSGFAMTGNLEAKKGFVGTQTCINCHITWQDNNPLTEDVISGNANPADYVPLNLRSTHAQDPFYTIPEGYVSSMHNVTQFDLVNADFVKCEGCHGSGLAHFGIGAIPNPIPGIDTCGGCHNEAQGFPFQEFLVTSHANSNKTPKKFFDQKNHGIGQARTTFNVPEQVSLFKAGTFDPLGDPVSKNERIEECSVCHNYALGYPQFNKKIAQGQIPKPAVSCGACHDAHTPAPSGNEPAVINGIVSVTALSGTTVVSAAPVPTSKSYLNQKPHKIGPSGAQAVNGTWTRGSAIARPTFSIVNGVGTLSVSGGAEILTFAGGGFQGKVREFNTVFISGKASATVNLPAAAINAGAPVTVEATFDRNGLEVLEVRDDNTLVLGAAPTTTATVIYRRTAGGTANLSVPIRFTGPVNFEVRDMYTNTENLCGSCHTRGTHKFSSMGRKRDGTLVDVSRTHNNDVMGQYLVSGHANRLAPAFEEFTAFGGHKIMYPFDQSIDGTGGVGSLRNRSNTSFQLTQTPDPANAYLTAPGNRTLPLVTSTSFDCMQCHHGLGAVDFINGVQGTPDASVLWGDANPTCLTCHDPHTNRDKNVRIPAKLSINARLPGGTINKFLDGTDIPPEVGNGAICLFCHQGRESGLTVFIRFQEKSIDPYANPDAVLGGVTFPNPHYLDSGSLVWSRNMWEFFFNNVPQTYSSGVVAHQNVNCAGCHMGEASPNGLEGGHTWRPRIETCQQCHGTTIQKFSDIPASADYDGDGQAKTVFEEIGTVSPDGRSGTGLFGQIVAALQAKGIFYNPDSRPYFFDAAGVGWNRFTSKTLGAAFNLGLAWKSGTCVYYHNAPYIVQIFQDSLRALDVTPTGVRPFANRNATDYRAIQNSINP